MSLPLRILIFRIIPVALFGFLIFLKDYRGIVVALLLIYGIGLQVYGKDFSGNDVILGIKKSTWRKWRG